MPTECSADLFGFAPVERRAVVAGFNGGRMTSDAGALLPGATDRAIGLLERFAACFTDGRAAELIEHEVSTLVGQRICGIALGYSAVRARTDAPFLVCSKLILDNMTNIGLNIGSGGLCRIE